MELIMAIMIGVGILLLGLFSGASSAEWDDHGGTAGVREALDEVDM